MGNRQQHALQRQETASAALVGKHVPQSSLQEKEKIEVEVFNYLENVFEAFSDAVIIYDQSEMIMYMNTSAFTFFEVPSEANYRGMSFQQFCHRYGIFDKPPQATFPMGWLMDLFMSEVGKTIFLHLPSGREIFVALLSAPLHDAQQQTIGTVLFFYEMTTCYQKMLHLQSVWESVSDLNEAVVRVPANIEFTFLDDILLSPPVLFISQQLVDVLRRVLACRRVDLIALGLRTESLSYVAGSGLTHEQEQYLQEQRGRFSLSQYTDATSIARLHANLEVVVPADQLQTPPGFHHNFGANNLLWVPMFIKQCLVGVLGIEKEGVESAYTLEEITLVKAVAAQAVLIIECLQRFCAESEKQITARLMNEMHHLNNEFLTLAGHELRTPLTLIKGNLQVAQRRLERLNSQVTTQPEHIKKCLEPLISATQSARLQQQIIDALIDDLRIQTNTFQLYRKSCDLLVLLKEVVARQQSLAPTCPIQNRNPA